MRSFQRGSCRRSATMRSTSASEGFLTGRISNFSPVMTPLSSLVRYWKEPRKTIAPGGTANRSSSLLERIYLLVPAMRKGMWYCIGGRSSMKNRPSVKVRITDRDPRILPEMGARVEFLDSASTATDAPTRIFVPAQAVRSEGSGTIVWVVRAGRVAASVAARRLIELMN